jgi:dTDP-4-amino-4,6-dideoxygalactose transaminase
MQFIDLKSQYTQIKEQINSGIERVLEHGRYVFGPEIEELEEKLAKFAGTKHAVACSSGTDALLMPLMAWGIGAGDAVFTTPFTFVASAEVICLAGATPVFVDINEKTYNIDPEKLEAAIEKVKQEGKLVPKAIIPVDLFGLPAELHKLEAIAERHGLKLLEDAAQGFGGSLDGKRAGSFGDAGATSFFPAKPLGCYGDGGAVFTNDDDLKERLVSIRVHGMSATERYDNVRIGLNARMDSMQAAVLLAKLDIFENELVKRNEVAARYTAQLSKKLVTPFVPGGYYSCWAQYSVLAKDSQHRDELRAKLQEQGVPTAVYYPIPLHLQTGYSFLGYKAGDMPVCEGISERIFSLPMHPYLSTEEIDKICEII